MRFLFPSYCNYFFIIYFPYSRSLSLQVPKDGAKIQKSFESTLVQNGSISLDG